MSYTTGSGTSPYNSLSPMPLDNVTGLPSPTGSGVVSTVAQVSSSVEGGVMQAAVSTSVHDPVHQLSAAQFEKQPPDNMRKSNFFNFIISIFDSNQQRVEVQKATFKDFYDTNVNGQEYRNGLIYQLIVLYSDGTQKEEDLYIRLIDSCTKQLVAYEGTCKNPDFRRVLLTHELICSRCLEHRSCGNKNDTPSDPIIVDRYRLKFFVKCNQNCLKNAGNPKDSRRRFQVALYTSLKVNGQPIACSEAMFVHNNSKHGRNVGRSMPPYRDAVVGDGKPFIIAVYPHEGWTTGGTRVCIVGMNFYEGVEVVFGTLSASAEYLSPNAIAVRTPQSPRPGEVDITLVFKGSQFCIANPGKFLYMSPDENSFDHNFSRLERLLRNHDELEDIPKSVLLKRAADALETFYIFPRPVNQPGNIGPVNHISPGPIYYPKSPAIFTPAILTPHQFTQARLNPGITFSPDKHSGGHVSGIGVYPHHHQQVDGHKLDPGEGSSTGAVSRCSSNETVVVQNQHTTATGVSDPASSQGSYFTFPPPESMGEIKTEPMNPGGIHKPKPLTPGPHLYSAAAVAMPFVQFAPMNSQYTGYLNSAEVNGYANLGAIGGDGGNRNNNNSSHSMANFAPVFIPPSPGFFVAPTASPGPLPVTPTGPGGSSVFNFCSPPMVSPGKPFRPVSGGGGSKTAKPMPVGMTNTVGLENTAAMQNIGMVNYPSGTMFAALPSPNIPGAFIFPPTTPTGQLIAPINLPDLSTSSDNVHTSTVSTTASVSRSTDMEEPPTKRRREAAAESSPMPPPSN